MQKLAVLLFLLFATVAVQAQSKGDKQKNVDKSGDWGATYKVDSKKAIKAQRKLRKSLHKQFDQKKEEFYDRMEANAKKREKMAKEMNKPQYSDPMYFGHKTPPKKRPPGKKKFCKECKMRH
jgi:hypothetical protein